MKRTPIPFIRILMLLMLGSAVCHAQRVIYVNDPFTSNDLITSATGNDANDGATPATPVATLSQAMSLAGNGDRILIDAGTYLAEALTVKSGVTIIGIPNDRSILTVKTSPIVMTANTQLWNLTIQRVIPMAAGYPSISLATSAGSSNILIENCIFTKNRTAIYLEPGSTDITIKRNRFDDNRTGIIFPGSAGATTLSKIYLVDNDLSANRSYGLILTDNSLSPVEMYLSGNNITGNLASGIEIDNSHPNTKIVMRNNWLGQLSPSILTLNTNGGFNVPDHDTHPVSAVLFNNNSIPGAVYPNQISGSNTGSIQTSDAVYASSINSRLATVNFVSSSSTNITGHSSFNYFPSIADAIAGSNVDATISLPAGIYSDNVIINKKITLAGANRQTTILRGTYDLGIQGAVMTIAAAGAKVEGMTITRDYGSSEAVWKADKMDSGISVTANDAVLNELTIKDHRSGIYIHNRQNFRITNSLIEHNRTGLSLGVDISSGIIENNVVRNNFTHGIIFNHAFGSGITANNFRMKHNIFQGNWLTDVYAHGPGATSVYASAQMACNDYGINAPSTSTTSASEPGYADQTPIQFSGTSPGFVANFAGDKISNVQIAPWLVSLPDPGPTALRYLPGAAPLAITPVTPPLSVANNDYRILANAIGCVQENQTINLSGTFDWTTPEALDSWTRGTNNQLSDGNAILSGTGDDFSITPPAVANGVTITSVAGATTIQGPGDLASTSLETFLFLNNIAGSSHKDWTMSNLIIKDFDVAVIMDHNAGPTDGFSNFKFMNNEIHVPADLNATEAPADNFQNIGLHYSFGKNIEISGNQFFINGLGMSDDAGSKYSSSNAIQSNTSGGTIYDGLKIKDNSFIVNGIASAQPAVIRGIWENGHNINASILIENNRFSNQQSANTAYLNRQTAMWITSKSGASQTVQYRNNEVSGYMEGIAWMGGSYTSYTPPAYNTGHEPVLLNNNKFENVKEGVVIRKDPASTNPGSPAMINQNSFVGSLGWDIRNEGSGAADASCNWFDGGALLSNTAGGSITAMPTLIAGLDDDLPRVGFQNSNACEYPVKNLRTLETFPTIQASIADGDTQDGDEIRIGKGTYQERVTLIKSLILTGESATETILDGAGLAGTGSGITIPNGKTGVTIQTLTIQNYTGTSGNNHAGIYATGGNNNLTIRKVTSKNQISASGIYANGPIDQVFIDSATVQNNGAGARGIVIWNGFKTNITIQNSLVENNNCCGVELQDGTASGVLIKGNTIVGNDNALGLMGLTSGAGPNIIENNIITVNGRYGIEVKNPNGTGNDNDTEDGAIILRNNNVTFGATTDLRDLAGIAVYRRGVNPAINTEIPTGVVVKNNTVSGFKQDQAGSSSEGFGIVAEGTNHHIISNTVTDSDIGIQRQSGHIPYLANSSTDGNQNDLADQYFGRGNAPYSCGIMVSGNTSSNDRDVMYLPEPGVVVNTSTGKTFCSIQTAINDPGTVDSHTLSIADGIFRENINIGKSLVLKGKSATASAVKIQAPVSGTGNGINVSAPQVGIHHLQITDFSYGIELKNNAHHLVVENSEVIQNATVGIRAGTSAINISNLTIRNSKINNNGQGLVIYGANSTDAKIFDGTYIARSEFNNNLRKGIYLERASNLTLDTVSVINSGIDPSYASNNGIDLNLKFGSFDNIIIQHSTIMGSGVTGTATDPEAPTALTIKARRDPSSYNAAPATLTNVLLKRNVIGGPQNGIRIGENGKTDDGSSGVVLEENDLSAAYAGKALINRTAANITLTCNWFGVIDQFSVLSKLSTASTGINNLGSLAENDIFSNCVAPLVPTTFWVNDLSALGDLITTGLGNDAQPGTKALPFLTISKALSTALAGDTIIVDAGLYTESLVINKKIKLYGASKGVNPNLGLRAAESIIVPASTDISDGSILLVTGTIDSLEIDGFTLDGDNASISGGVVINGKDIDAAEAISAYDGVSNIRILNNIIQNLAYAGVDLYNDGNAGAATSGNLIQFNRIDNIQPDQFGIGVLLYNNAYANILSNGMTRVRTGIQTGNFYRADPGDSHRIAENIIASEKKGIWHNLAYQNAANFTITANTLSSISPTVRYDGIMISSLSNQVGTLVSDNQIIGQGDLSNGYQLWNNPSNLVHILGGTVSNVGNGVTANNWEGYPESTGSNGSSSLYSIENLVIQNARVGIRVHDNPANTNGALVTVLAKGTSLVELPLLSGVSVTGKDAQAVMEGVQINLGPSSTEAIGIQETAAATRPNLILHTGFTVNRTGNTTAHILQSSEGSIVSMGSSWTLPGGGPVYPFIIKGKLLFESGLLFAPNDPVYFTASATDIQEKSLSHIVGKARMASRLIGTGALSFLGVNLPSGADLGEVVIERQTTSLPISPALAAGAVNAIWNITPTQAAAGRNGVTLSILTDFMNSQSASELFAFRYNGTLWEKKSSPLTASLAGDIYTTSAFDVTGFSPWTLSSASNPLPVHLLSFEGMLIENRSVLNWSTGSETNSEGFDIEHSANGLVWNRIGHVTATGESSSLQRYSYTHDQPLAYDNLYRLKMMDRDGSYSFSRMVNIHAERQITVQAYPNPTAEYLKIGLDDWSQVKAISMIDRMGRVVYHDQNSFNKVIDVRSFDSGLYMIEILHRNAEKNIVKVVISR